MSLRTTRLLSAALIGACLVSSGALAATHHRSKSHVVASKNTSTLIWRGDDATASGVVNEVARAWERTGHGHIELQPFNTASGIDAVSSGTADLAGSARASDGSPENARLTFTPVAWDAVVIITQASNPIRSLSLKQVHDIYYGRIHNWSEVGGRNAPIDVYAVASPGDGVEYSLRSLLFGRGNQPVAAPRLYVNTRKLEEGVALNPNGLGAATLAGISGNPKVKAIPINGISATPAHIANGSYPLFIPLYLVTNPNSPKAAQAQAFVNFMQTAPAAAALRAHGVLPYQDGGVLVALDSSRRDGILTEVGAPRNRLALYPNAGQRADTSLAEVNALAAAQQRTSTGNASPTSSADAGDDAAAVTTPSTTYTVVHGDTLSSIAKKHAVSIAQLRRWNHLRGNEIQLGQVLRISDR